MTRLNSECVSQSINMSLPWDVQHIYILIHISLFKHINPILNHFAMVIIIIVTQKSLKQYFLGSGALRSGCHTRYSQNSYMHILVLQVHFSAMFKVHSNTTITDFPFNIILFVCFFFWHSLFVFSANSLSS